MELDQPSLFGPNVRPSDPATSHAAAMPERVTLRQQVELVLRRYPSGVTDWEATSLLGLAERRKPSVAKRRQEIGAIDTGRRRPSPDGMSCVVWAHPTWSAGTEWKGAASMRSTTPPSSVAPADHTDL